jgi:hypothetical protein
MLHKTAQERYEKLKKVFTRLMNRFDRDDLDDFIQVANSLPEWIRRDRTLSQAQKDALESFVVAQSLDWQICHQLANAQKHGGAKGRPRGLPAEAPALKSAKRRPGGAGVVLLPSMRVIGAGDEIEIEYDEHRESALAFVVRTFKHFHYIFELAPIPPGERVIPTLTQLLGG